MQSTNHRPRLGILVALIGFLILALVTGKLPNPLDRFFEIDAAMYHTLGEVVVASKSTPLQATIKAALDDDGKLTLANMSRIWPVYMKAIPDGMTVPAAGAGELAAERERMISLVQAKPKRSAWTFL
jgi:hypothetical protein